MTPARMREIVAALRSPDGWAGTPSEVSDALLLLADIAGIDAPDVDLDGFTERAEAALGDSPEPWEANASTVVWVAPGLSAGDDWEIGPNIFAADGTTTASVAQHIAGAHPAAMLALLARLRREMARADAAEAERDMLRSAAKAKRKGGRKAVTWIALCADIDGPRGKAGPCGLPHAHSGKHERDGLDW